jgi:hypothetical protein
MSSRFGFLKGAVGAVKSVWNRGAGASSSTAIPTTAALTKSKINTSAVRPSNVVSPSVPAARNVSAGLNRGVIPTFGSSAKSRVSSTATGTSSSRLSTTQKTGSTTKSKISQITSVGFKRRSQLDAAETGSTRGSIASRREKASTFMAPTQSSLAKAQVVRTSATFESQSSYGTKLTNIPTPSSSGFIYPAPLVRVTSIGSMPRQPGDITNLAAPATGRRALPIPPQQPGIKDKIISDGRAGQDKAAQSENMPIENTLSFLSSSAMNLVQATGSLTRKPSHHPRISRSHVVAKLHARRLASDSSRRSSASSRRSLQRKSISGAAASGGVKASMGVSRYSGASGASGLAAKRRIRASEVAKRKSRAPLVSTMGT